MTIEKLYSAFKESAGVVTDSRKISGGEMFFALKGENFDGNEYAEETLSRGAKYAVVNEGSKASSSGDERVIVVPDTLQTLQDLARYHRENTFVDGKRLTVIGLTGTNGKTTTKELLTRVLSTKFKVTSTQGNLNNDIGVPLSLLSIDSSTQIAVIEMGASHPDDICHLVNIAEPDFGLITNVGKAHLLGFGSFEGVKKAKGKLYDYINEHKGGIFLNADDEILSEMAASRKNLQVFKYGIEYWGAVVLPSDSSHPFVRMAIPSTLNADGDDTLLGVDTHLVGEYNSVNVAAAVAVGVHFGVSLDDALCAVGDYVPTNNRSQMERTERNIVIEDAYNANPTSMAAALKNLEFLQASTKVALLGDMRELGAESANEHLTILEKVISMNLSLVCLVGAEFEGAAKSLGTLPDSVKLFHDSDTLASWLKENPISDASILVKGSRGIQMENVIASL